MSQIDLALAALIIVLVIDNCRLARRACLAERDAMKMRDAARHFYRLLPINREEPPAQIVALPQHLTEEQAQQFKRGWNTFVSSDQSGEKLK